MARALKVESMLLYHGGSISRGRESAKRTRTPANHKNPPSGTAQLVTYHRPIKSAPCKPTAKEAAKKIESMHK